MKQQFIKEVRKLQEIAGIEEIVVKPVAPTTRVYLVVKHQGLEGEFIDADAFAVFRNREEAEEYGDNLDLDYAIVELELH